MAVAISLILYTVGILTLLEGYAMVRHHGNIGKKYVLYGITAFFSSVWNISYGILWIQTSTDIARLCRSIGMAAVFLFFFAMTGLVVQWLDGARLFKTYVRVFSALGILLWPFVIGENSVTFMRTWMGMTYHFSQNIFNTLYNLYCVIYGINLFVLLAYIHKQAKRKKLQAIVKGLGICCIVVLIGMIFDTLLPIFGFDAIPTSTLFQGIGTLMVARVLEFQKTSEITVENFSEFVYYLVDMPVLIYDEDGRFRLGNNGAMDFFNAMQNDIYGKSLWDTFDVDEQCLSFSGSKKYEEAECVINNRFCQIEISKIFDEYEYIIGYIVVLSDLTQKRNFIKQLQESERAAEMANYAKSNFLARMSHEIRTPINGVIGMNELILEKSTEKQIIEYSRMVKISAQSLIELVNDILDISKIEANHTVVENNVYSFRDLLQDLYALLKVRANKKNIEFMINLERPIRLSLNGDEKKVRQIIANVMSNAVKYTKEGSVIVSVDSFWKNGQYFIKVVVSDTGIGIKEENLEKIFEAFERVGSPENKGIEGTGLGLSIVKSLVELMDGSVEVSSVYGEGSTFTIILPQKPADEDTFDNLIESDEDKIDSDMQEMSISIPGKRILVVDDNEINRVVAGELLSYTKANVETVDSGKECLERVRSNKYDFILLDHLMPEMDGIEVLKELKNMSDNKSRSAIHIVLTANAIQGAKEEYLAHGFDDYLSKPIDILEVEKVLKKYC